MSYECRVDPLDALGRFVCFFNNVNLNCTTDLDCPGDAQCFLKGTKWSARDQQCACSMTFQKAGVNCRQTGGNIAGLIVITVIGILVYVAAIILNILAAYYLVEKKKTSLYFTIFCCFFSSIFGIAVFSVYIAQLTAGLPFFVSLTEKKKFVALVDESNHLIAMLFLFTCVGVLNVSVTWVYVSEKVRTNDTTVADKYRKGINIFFAFFILALIILQTDRSFQPYVQYVCIPSIVYFSVGFLVGYFRLRKHIKKSLAMTKYGGSVATREKMIMIEKTISRTTLLCSFHSCCLIIFVVIGAVLGIDGDTPAYPTVSIIYQIAYVFAALLILQVSWYTFSFANDRKRHSPTTESDQQVSPVGDTFSSNDPKYRGHGNKDNTKASTTDNGSIVIMNPTSFENPDPVSGELVNEEKPPNW